MIELEKFDKIYEGKAKILYETSDPNYLIQYFKDDITAGNGEKKDTLAKKGIYNQSICTTIYEYLSECKIDTHLIKSINSREQIVKRLSIFPIEVIIRNYAAGSICRRYNIKKGYKFSTPLLELFYKNDSLNDPLVVDALVTEMNWCNNYELKEIRQMAHIINHRMIEFWNQYNITLVDAKYEFGLDCNLDIILGDEITPDTQRLWNRKGESLDKDIFREGNDMLKVSSVYEHINELVNYQSIKDRSENTFAEKSYD